MKSNRISVLDGIRTLAALGVVWIHVWESWGHPALKYFHIDFYRLIAIVGNGVDLFFVISGFCMYLMYGKNSFSWQGFIHFIKKRWLRIAPAFYVAALVYGLVTLHSNNSFPLIKALCYNIFFLQNTNQNIVISTPFWSLATEWYFYLILPLMLLLARKFGFLKSVSAFIILSLFAGLLFYYQDAYGWSTSILVRLVEFLWGMIAAEFYTKNKISELKPYLKWWVGISIAYLGRILMLTEVVDFFGHFGFIIKAMGAPIMTLGFALFILYLLENPFSVAGRLFSAPIMLFLGRISYSIYLWHSLVKDSISNFLEPRISVFHNLAPIIAFIIISIFTVGLSFISYKLLEEPYFKKRNKLATSL